MRNKEERREDVRGSKQDEEKLFDTRRREPIRTPVGGV